MASAVSAQDFRTSSGPSMRRFSARAGAAPCRRASETLSGGDRFSIAARRGARPAHESAMKGADIGKTEQKRDFLNAEPTVAQVTLGQLAAHLVDPLGERRALALEPALQGARRHAQAQRDLLERQLTLAQRLADRGAQARVELLLVG